jgi:hypothetical protein
MSDVIHTTPKATRFLAEHKRDIGYPAALYELIDNSFDAGAKRVVVTIRSDKRLVSVEDDGAGTDDLSRMVQEGERADHLDTESGEYGVGAKAAALFFWGVYRVVSRKDGIQREVSIDWDEQVRCSYPATPFTKSNTDKPNGTLVEFRDINRGAPNYENLKRFLSDEFSPALSSGRKIVISTKNEDADLKPAAGPDFLEKIPIGGEVRGLKWDGYAGIVRGSNPHPGCTLSKAHRIVSRSFSDFCGEYIISSFHAAVFLRDRQWKLNTFKKDLDDPLIRAELNSQLLTQCEELLKRSHAESSSIELDLISDALSDVLFGDRKIRLRNPAKNESGTVEPRETPKNREDTPKDTDGDNFPKVKGGALRIEPTSLNGKIAAVTSRNVRGGKLYTVHINKDREDIAAARAKPGQSAILFLAVSMMVQHVSRSREEMEPMQKLMGDLDGEAGSEFHVKLWGKWFPRLIKKIESSKEATP